MNKKEEALERIVSRFREFDDASWNRVEFVLMHHQYGITWGGLEVIRNYIKSEGDINE